MVDHDKILGDLYGRGIYQVLITFICSTTSLLSGMEITSISFLDDRPKFNCTDPLATGDASVRWITEAQYEKALRNESIGPLPKNAEQCWGLGRQGVFECHSYQYYGGMMVRTVISDYNLVCGRRYLVEPFNFIYFLFLANSYCLGIFLDRLGRRRPMLILGGIQCIVQVVYPFAPNIYVLFIFRALRGSLEFITYLSICTVTELVPINKRSLYGNCFWFGWAFGYMLESGFAYAVRDWKVLRYLQCLPLLVYPSFYFLVPETPRWLSLSGRNDEALATLQFMARLNNPKLEPDYFETLRADMEEHTEKAAAMTRLNARKKETLLDGFRNLQLLVKLIVFSIAHITIALAYYGLSTSGKFAAEDIFVNSFLQGVVEIPSSLLAWIAADKLGRRPGVLVLMLIAAVSIAVVEYAKQINWLRIIIAVAAKLTLTAAYCIADVYIAELLPTTIRTSGFFFVVALAAYVGAFSQFINQMNQHIVNIIYGSLAALGGIVVFVFLPETRGYPMPDTIEESKGFTRSREQEWLQNRKSKAPCIGSEILVDSTNSDEIVLP